MSVNKVFLKYNTRKYPTDVIRYVFYTLTSKYWVLISKEKNDIKVELSSINNEKIDIKKLKKQINEEFKDEIIRKKIFEDNLKLREYLIKKAITYTPPQPNQQINEELSPEDEKELEKIIKEVEEEIKKEMKKEKENEIKKTWEEKYGKSK